jgi:hypothetical protein
MNDFRESTNTESPTYLSYRKMKAKFVSREEKSLEAREYAVIAKNLQKALDESL